MITRRQFCTSLAIGSLAIAGPAIGVTSGEAGRNLRRVVVLDTETTGLDWRQGIQVRGMTCCHCRAQ